MMDCARRQDAEPDLTCHETDAWDSSVVQDFDIHPIEPWLLFNHARERLVVWNYEDGRQIADKVCRGQSFFAVARFLPDKGWIVAVEMRGCLIRGILTMYEMIRLAEPNTRPNNPNNVSSSDSDKMREIYKVQEIEVGYQLVRTLTVHPTSRYILALVQEYGQFAQRVYGWDADKLRDKFVLGGAEEPPPPSSPSPPPPLHHQHQQQHAQPNLSHQKVMEKDDGDLIRTAFHPVESNVVATGAFGGNIKVWNVEKRMVLHGFDASIGGISAIQFAGEGQISLLIVGHKSGQIHVWDYKKRACVSTLVGHGSPVINITSFSQLPCILSLSKNGTLRFWNDSNYSLIMAYRSPLEDFQKIAICRVSDKVVFGGKRAMLVVDGGILSRGALLAEAAAGRRGRRSDSSTSLFLLCPDRELKQVVETEMATLREEWLRVVDESTAQKMRQLEVEVINLENEVLGLMAEKEGWEERLERCKAEQEKSERRFADRIKSLDEYVANLMAHLSNTQAESDAWRLKSQQCKSYHKKREQLHLERINQLESEVTDLREQIELAEKEDRRRRYGGWSRSMDKQEQKEDGDPGGYGEGRVQQKLETEVRNLAMAMEKEVMEKTIERLRSVNAEQEKMIKQLESAVSNLTVEREALKERLEQIRSVENNVGQSTSEQEGQEMRRINQLKTELRNLTVEREALRARLEELRLVEDTSERSRSEKEEEEKTQKRINQLETEVSKLMVEIEALEARLEELRLQEDENGRSRSDKKEEQENRRINQLETEVSNLTVEREALQERLTEIRSEHDKLEKISCAKIQRLEMELSNLIAEREAALKKDTLTNRPQDGDDSELAGECACESEASDCDEMTRTSSASGQLSPYLNYLQPKILQPGNCQLDSQQLDNRQSDNPQADDWHLDSQQPGNLQSCNPQAHSLQADSRQAESRHPHSPQADSWQADSLHAQNRQMESRQAESWQPDNLQPESRQADSQVSDSPQLDSQQAESRQPDNLQPHSRHADSQHAASRQPDNLQPDGRKAESQYPDNLQPDDRQAGSWQPDNRQPDSGQAGGQQVDCGQLDGRQPDVYQVTPFREFSLQELEDATNNFHDTFKLEDREYGSFYEGKFVVKKLVKTSGSTVSSFVKLNKDLVERLWSLRHPHLRALLGVCYEGNCLVYEHVANGNVREWIFAVRGAQRPKGVLTWPIRLRIMAQVAQALCFLHSNLSVSGGPIIHCGISPNNILLDKDFVAKIGEVDMALIAPDFCEEEQAHDIMHVSFGTAFHYIAPELVRTGAFDEKSDVYAFGITLLEMLTGKSKLALRTIDQAVKNVAKFKNALDLKAGDWDLDLALEAARLGLRCASLDTADRPSLMNGEGAILPALQNIARKAELTVSPGNPRVLGHSA